jgi:hypothetical protein
MKNIALAIGLLAATMLARAQEKPPSHYEKWGVCPFECCTYREWTAKADIPVHARRSDASPVLFDLHRGEALAAVTGVVVTEHPAVIHIDHEVHDGFIDGDDRPRLALKPGDRVYMLTPLGEGLYLYWYHGKVYHSGIDLSAMPGVDGKGMTFTWWKQVRNQAGQTGWTKSDDFGNVDACG